MIPTPGLQIYSASYALDFDLLNPKVIAHGMVWYSIEFNVSLDVKLYYAIPYSGQRTIWSRSCCVW